MGVRSATALMKVAASPLLDPYGADAFTGAAGAMRFLGGLIVRIALLTPAFIPSAAGWLSSFASEAKGTTASRGAQSCATSSDDRSEMHPSTRPPCTAVRTAAHPESPVAWAGMTLRAAVATDSSLLASRCLA